MSEPKIIRRVDKIILSVAAVCLLAGLFSGKLIIVEWLPHLPLILAFFLGNVIVGFALVSLINLFNSKS